MRRLTLADLTAPGEYERTRAEFRRRIIELKRHRRVTVGDRVSLVFENRETALSQVQEMVRAERIVEPEKIQFEIDTYNALIPEPGGLSATLFIEITTAPDLRAELDRFIGLDRPGTVFFDLGKAGRVEGAFEKGHSDAQRISAVHYVTFDFTPDQRRAFMEAAGAGSSLSLAIEHPNYRHRAVVSEEVLKSLAEDLMP
ncbi:MAG TPA: DUF3501 family protein [Candidatus Polarisedimenticolia bacterium]|jgi:hypothetical protein